MTHPVVAFDLFGTVYDMSNVDRAELREYGEHLREFYETGVYKPLRLPESWKDLEPFEDSKASIIECQANGCIAVTCSNAPFELQKSLLEKSGIPFDGICPMESVRVFKTHPSAYLQICNIWRVTPADVFFVTGNKHFGDIEASSALGMSPNLVRDPDGFPDLFTFAATLGEML